MCDTGEKCYKNSLYCDFSISILIPEQVILHENFWNIYMNCKRRMSPYRIVEMYIIEFLRQRTYVYSFFTHGFWEVILDFYQFQIVFEISRLAILICEDKRKLVLILKGPSNRLQA